MNLSRLNPLHSFFGKIFLWFWLTLSVIIIITVIFVTRWKEPYQLLTPTPVQLQQFNAIAHQLANIKKPSEHLQIPHDQPHTKLPPRLRQQLKRKLHALRKEYGADIFLFDHEFKLLGKRRFPPIIFPMLSAMHSNGKATLGKWHHEQWVGSKNIVIFDHSFSMFIRTEKRHRGSPFQRLIKNPLMQLLFSLPLTLLLSYWLAWSLSKPLKRLGHAAQKIGEGQLTTQLTEKDCARQDEIGNLARQFNTMSSQLASMMDTQKRLLGNISHELRSPLTRLQVALAIAEKNASQDIQPMLERIGLEGDRLEQMIQQVLLLAKLESVSAQWPMEAVDLFHILRTTIADGQFEAESLNKEVVFSNTSNDNNHTVVLHGNEPLLHSAIENIIRNAIHHTPVATTVTVNVTAVSNRWVITICDQGKGVPEDKIRHMFDPFFRIDQTDTKTGMGLGLSIAEHAIAKHGGNISAYNAPQGGLCVRIDLPGLDPTPILD